MADKSKMGPIGNASVRTYRGEGGALTRGTAVIIGTADDQVKAPSAAGDKPHGVVAESTTAAGQPVKVVTHGEVIAIAGGAIAKGDSVKIGGTNGRLVATTTDNDWIVGIARSSADADGDEFVLDVLGPSRY